MILLSKELSRVFSSTTVRKSFIDWFFLKRVYGQNCPANKKRAASGGREPRSPGGFRMSQAGHTLGTPDWELRTEKRGWGRATSTVPAPRLCHAVTTSLQAQPALSCIVNVWTVVTMPVPCLQWICPQRGALPAPHDEGKSPENRLPFPDPAALSLFYFFCIKLPAVELLDAGHVLFASFMASHCHQLASGENN